MKTSEFTFDHLARMEKGIKIFNDQLYWECHEELEGIWLEDRGDNVRNVYWAVIQVAAAMVHYENSNPTGAHGLLKKSKEKFQRVKDFGIENELIYNYLDWKELTKIVYSIPENADLDQFKKMYEFRFKAFPFNQVDLLSKEQ